MAITKERTVELAVAMEVVSAITNGTVDAVGPFKGLFASFSNGVRMALADPELAGALAAGADFLATGSLDFVSASDDKTARLAYEAGIEVYTEVLGRDLSTE